jgi:O-antigen ligase
MPRRNRNAKAGAVAVAKSAASPRPPQTEILAWWAVAFALCSAAWIIDPFADAAFDAPKWFCVLLGAAVAGVSMLAQASMPDWRSWSASAKWILTAALAGMLWLLLATLLSPHPQLAWPSLRRDALLALFALVGASRLLDGKAGKYMLGVFLLACATNAVVSLGQYAGLELLPIAQVGGRFATGALLGNEGFVALACAMMAAASIACALDATSLRQRIGFVMLAGLGLLVIVINQQKTAAAALMAALLVVVALRWRLRWLFAVMAGLLLLGTVSVLVPPLRTTTWATLPLANYQRITTYRLGPWIAAVDMANERPLSGYGPGAFEAEMQKHSFAAEIRLRERLVPPIKTTFVYAHQDYLQLAAEAGIPTLLLFLGAILALFGKLALRVPTTLEQQVLLAISAVGMIAALGWFPMHIPFTACVLLLCAGRAWRLLAMLEAAR